MVLIVDREGLDSLLKESIYHVTAIRISLATSIDFNLNFHTPEKIRANYKVLSQIFDDLVRIDEIADGISTSLSQTETEVERLTP